MNDKRKSDTSDPFLRFAGFGGFGFLATVFAENVMRQPQPLANATVEEIAAYYLAKPSVLALSESLFVIAIPCLMLFAIGTARRLRPAAEAWGQMGAISAFMMTATFGATMALDVVLNATAETLVANAALTLALWRLKVAVFTVNLVALSCTILAFGIGSHVAGILPRWFAKVTAVAGVIGLLGAFPMKSVVLGSPWGLLGLLCFLEWLFFLVAMSIGHLRAARAERMTNSGTIADATS